MVDIAGAASGPLLAGRPDSLQTASQTSQVATDSIAPEQASGVTAPANIDADGEGGQGNAGQGGAGQGNTAQPNFENPASGQNAVQAQLAGSEQPLTPIEEAILDFPPDAVVRQQEILSGAFGAADSVATDAPVDPVLPEAGQAEIGITDPATEDAALAVAVAEDSAEVAAAPVAGDSGGNEFGVTEEQAGQQAQAVASENQPPPPSSEPGGRGEAPDTNLTGANDNPFAIANGSAGEGQPATQPPGSVVDFAA